MKSTPLAFFLFGLINNLFYVLLLSAALDLLSTTHPPLPPSTILLASILPALATKSLLPHLLHRIPYNLRPCLLALLSTAGILTVALSSNDNNNDDEGGGGWGITCKLLGIVIANISSSAGETAFLSLTHFYGRGSLAGWSSGTGGAGLVGAGVYALATNVLGWSAQRTLLVSSIVPVGMVGAYFGLLPRGPLVTRQHTHRKHDDDGNDDDTTAAEENDDLLNSFSRPQSIPSSGVKQNPTLRTRLQLTLPLLLPYMLPLFLVYLAEYTINLSLHPLLLFPLSRTPFTTYRSFYPTYALLYQAGVFVSRSSLPFFRVRRLYLPACLQVVNLGVLLAQVMFAGGPLGSVWVVMGVVFWEGLLGGLVYVSTYAAVREEVGEERREFSLAAVSVSDSGGILLAGLLGLWMEPALCAWQVRGGREWCLKV